MAAALCIARLGGAAASPPKSGWCSGRGARRARGGGDHEVSTGSARPGAGEIWS
jgi:hypothetical protein